MDGSRWTSRDQGPAGRCRATVRSPRLLATGGEITVNWRHRRLTSEPVRRDTKSGRPERIGHWPAWSDGLCELIRRRARAPVHFPALEILGPGDKQAARQALAAASAIRPADLRRANAVRLHSTAARAAAPSTHRISQPVGWRPPMRSNQRLEPTLVPQRMDSGASAAAGPLQSVRAKSVFILRVVVGGHCSARPCASVVPIAAVEVYRRQVPQQAGAAAVTWCATGPSWLGSDRDQQHDLDNLFDLLGGRVPIAVPRHWWWSASAWPDMH